MSIGCMVASMNQHWIFGYGSLMWKPGFSFRRSLPATIYGYRRALCVFSWVHRGTRENPGLVLGLDRGGSCTGIAFEVDPHDWEATVSYLRGREQVTDVYREATVQAYLSGGSEIVRALTFLVDRAHPQYTGKMAVKDQIEHVRHGAGQSGKNDEYVMNTLAHLRQMGIYEPVLEAVADGLKPHAANLTA
jgi:glutathione-specific gamma-glutamylcyclotransferase